MCEMESRERKIETGSSSESVGSWEARGCVRNMSCWLELNAKGLRF